MIGSQICPCSFPLCTASVFFPRMRYVFFFVFRSGAFSLSLVHAWQAAHFLIRSRLFSSRAHKLSFLLLTLTREGWSKRQHALVKFRDSAEQHAPFTASLVAYDRRGQLPSLSHSPLISFTPFSLSLSLSLSIGLSYDLTPSPSFSLTA